MKKWLRRTLIAIVLIALTLGGVYEAATHVVRGWWNGEAFYQGRPTSYWAKRCDEWLQRFDTPKEAAEFAPPGILVMPLSYWPQKIRPRPQTVWSRFCDHFRSADERERDDWPPEVLLAFPGSEEVLEELAKDEPYRTLALRPLRHAKFNRARGLE